MKKTLIALLALGSLAMGGETVSLFTIEPTTTTATTTSDSGSYTSTVLKHDASIDITPNNPSVSAISGSGSLTRQTDFTKSMFSVATNIGNGGSYTFEQAFTVEVPNGATITLTSIDVDFFAHDSTGVKQNSQREAYAILTLKQGNTPLFTSTQQGLSIPGVDGQNYVQSAYQGDHHTLSVPAGVGTFTLDKSVNLSAGNYTLSIAVAQKATLGTFIGIGHVEAKGTVSRVPEPATGSLSLLALAGLCARRRKK